MRIYLISSITSDIFITQREQTTAYKTKHMISRLATSS